ncbi:molybdopterin molybdotransferase MoeA [Demequina sp. SYSU T00192]|uniref:Molybdopterin molybdenumtransferase n=1 Tax=Demequina litoralis TaxID=3051660 RepID=A0ABT8G8R7_9MICO|nr:gephyrin-like molybdotransferase Glp [Demequina sp. SYSU T00192]MDN4475535.1 molybdopterin molybdotransferase MoeA [Demequina sp. SYSU T00192]
MLSRTLEEHRAAVTNALAPIPPLTVLVGDAAGATLVEPLVAAAPLPAHDVAAWDGYAVRAGDVGADALPVAHDVSFADRGPRTHLPGTAARVASGMPVPTGADAVVPLVATDRGVARVAFHAPVRAGAGVRRAGTDAAAGRMVVPAGRRLGGRELALAASLGHPRLTVRPVPRVVVLATGSELVDPGSGRAGVPEATGHLIAVAARNAGAHAYRVGPVPDDRPTLRTAIEDQLVRADLLIVTGGLSDGGQDTVAQVLQDLGDVDDVRLALEPGPHHAFAMLGEEGARRVPTIALPGAPAAAALAFEAYVRPALRRMCGFTEVVRPGVRGRLDRGWPSPPGITQAVPVRLGLDPSGTVTASPACEPGDVTLAALGDADGIAWVDAATTEVRAGDVLRCTVWDD